MSKQANAIIKAYQQGSADAKSGKPYLNPYAKSRQKDKHKAYRNGYNA